MSQPLQNILNQSSCLNKRQLAGYVRGKLSAEEAYAIETHLNSCILCSTAVDGMLLHDDAALEALGELSPAFIKEHFEKTAPQIHLNSVTAVSLGNTVRRKDRKSFHFDYRRAIPLAASILIAIGLLWFWKYGIVPEPVADRGALAMQHQPAAPAQEETSTADMAAPPVAQNTQNAKPKPAADLTPLATVAAAPEAKRDNAKSQAGPPLPPAADQSGAATEMAETVPAAKPAASTTVAPPAEQKGKSNATLSVARSAPSAGRAATSDEAPVTDELASADDQYEEGQYAKAILLYKRDAQSSDLARSQHARIMTARSYIKLGQPDKARPILQSIIDEGGPERRAARKLLRELD